LTATVEVAGPFKVETKPYTITLTGFAKAEDRPRIRTIRPSDPVVERHYGLKNWILIFVLVLLALGAAVVVIGAAVAGLLILRKKQ